MLVEAVFHLDFIIFRLCITYFKKKFTKFLFFYFYFIRR